MNKKCENPSCQNEGVKQYKSGWCCSAHCALSLTAKHSSQKRKENYNGHYKCPKCDSEFKTKTELQQHKNNVHCGNEIFKCICGKSFKSKRSLGIHKQSCEIYLKSIGKSQSTYVCNGCHKEFKSRASLQAHISHCELYIKGPEKGMHTSKYWNENKQIYICECEKEFKTYQSLNAHFSMCKIHKIAIGKEPKIAESKIRNGSLCNFSKEYLGEDGIQKMHEKSQNTIEMNIKNGKQYNFNVNKRGKHGWYKGFHCDSSWELAFVIYCLDYNISIKRCNQVFKYKYKEKWHRYYPDFEINGIIYEIKGYETEISKEKHKQFPYIKILYKNDLKDVFDYVIHKYGKNFIRLYET